MFSCQPFAWDVMIQKCLNNNDVSQYRHDNMIYSMIHNFMSNICYFTNMVLTQLMNLGIVSLTLHKLSKIILWKYTMPEITFMVRFSSWNFVCVPKASLWAHIQSFSLKFSWEVWFLQCKNFERIFCRARKMLVNHPLGTLYCHSKILPKKFVSRCISW